MNITLDLPKPIIVGKKFVANIKLNSENLSTKIDSIKLRFEGVEMDMGENIFALQKISDNQFQGEIIIPMCVTGKMLWRVSAEISFDNKQKGLVNWLFES